MENPKVLVIDDDPMTCNLLETILQMDSYQTSSLNHVNSAGIMPILEEHMPQILILDFHLGPQETLEYTTAIRADKTWSHLPILMTSAIDRSDDCLEAGANDFLLKPFDWQEIGKRVNRLRDDFIRQEV